MYKPGLNLSEGAVPLPTDDPATYRIITEDEELSAYEDIAKYYLTETASMKLLPGFDSNSNELNVIFADIPQPNVSTRKLDDKLYELKDHLGNIRATISDLKQEAPEGEAGFIPTVVSSMDYYPFGMDRTPVVWEEVEYLATFETDNTSFEQDFFNNRDNVQVVASDDYNHTQPTDDYNKAQRLSSADDKIIGLGKQLPVQAGDKVTMEVYGKYVSGPNNDPVVIGSNLASALLTSFGLPAGELQPGKANTIESQFASGSIFAYDGTSGGVRAYLNYVFLDEDYNLVTGGYAPLQDNFADPDAFQHLTLEYIPQQDGYLFVYLSDESQQPTEVYFDDFKVTHEVLIKDPQLETYRYGFNGKEKDSKGEFGLNHYYYGFRIYNPSIAKFLSVDPLTDSYPMLTPYQFASNRPIDGVDLDGLEFLDKDEARVRVVYGVLFVRLEGFNARFQRKFWELNPQYGLVKILSDGTATGAGQLSQVLTQKFEPADAPNLSLGILGDKHMSSRGSLSRSLRLYVAPNVIRTILVNKDKGAKPGQNFNKYGGISQSYNKDEQLPVYISTPRSPGVAKLSVGIIFAINMATYAMEMEQAILYRNELDQLSAQSKDKSVYTLSGKWENTRSALSKAILDVEMGLKITESWNLMGLEPNLLIPNGMRNISDLSDLINIVLYGGDGHERTEVKEVGQKIIDRVSTRWEKGSN